MFLPKGYTEKHDPKLWNRGQVFTWSDTLNGWVELQTITVRPQERPDHAYRRETGKIMPLGTKVLFVKGF